MLYQIWCDDLQAYFGKSSPKINHLRVDSLAMLLSLANVGSHGKVGTVMRAKHKHDEHLACNCSPQQTSVERLSCPKGAATALTV